MRPDQDHPQDVSLGRRDILVAGLTGAALLRLLRPAPAAADQAFDVQLLQTSASIENLAVAAYDTILGLPLMAAPTTNPALGPLFSTARAHHAAHAAAFTEAAAALGGKPQTGLNPALAEILDQERPRLIAPAPAVELALRIETVAAQTYQNNVGLVGDLNARNLLAGILAVEAQHVALLQVYRAAVAIPPPPSADPSADPPADPPALAALDAAVLTSGFPDAFTKVDQARPPAEGAVP